MTIADLVGNAGQKGAQLRALRLWISFSPQVGGNLGQVYLQIGRAIAALSVLYFHSWVALVRFPAGVTHPFWPLAKSGFRPV